MKLSLVKYLVKNKLLQIKQILKKDEVEIPKTDFLINFYKLPLDIMDKVKIVTFCNKNIHPNVPIFQKKIFEKFEIPLQQYIEDYCHPVFLKKMLCEHKNKEYVIIFDIDAIPLTKESIFSMIQDLVLGYKLVGAVQTANQYQGGKNNYVGPFFMGINVAFYHEIGTPDLYENGLDDVGGILTRICNEKQIPIKYWMPTDIEIPIWNLNGIGKFGLGTTYNGQIYHAFQVRDGNHYRFINKCKQLLS